MVQHTKVLIKVIFMIFKSQTHDVNKEYSIFSILKKSSVIFKLLHFLYSVRVFSHIFLPLAFFSASDEPTGDNHSMSLYFHHKNHLQIY